MDLGKFLVGEAPELSAEGVYPFIDLSQPDLVTIVETSRSRF
jgi:hypothetical protein